MKTKVVLLLIALIIVSCKENISNTEEHIHTDSKMEQTEPVKKKVLSPHTSAMAMIGDAHIHIDYSSPGVRNRIIFGGLVGYDAIWQAGAHNATWIETNKDLIINDEKLPAGKYGFFTIPSKEQWTVIFNKNWDQHGKDEYDSKDDILRFKVNPKSTDSLIEHLLYNVKKTNESEGVISMSWEKIKIDFPFKVE